MSKHKVKVIRRAGVWLVHVILDNRYWTWDFDNLETASKFADTLRESDVLSDGNGGLTGTRRRRKRK